MIDREQAIEAATRAYVSHPLTIERRVEAITDAILALPDPVHEAARRVVTADERRRAMIDREQAIEAAIEALNTEQRDPFPTDRAEAVTIVDAILALPDPVHAAARELVAAEERWNAYKRLRAALADER